MKPKRKLMTLLQFSKATRLPLEVVVKAIQRKRFAAAHGVVGELPKIDVEVFELRYCRRRRPRRSRSWLQEPREQS